jgi:hypothetical protein
VKRDDFVMAFITVVGSSATGFALAFMWKLGVKQEILVTFAGAIIGAAATIAGAAWLADRNRRIERDAESYLLAKELSKLLKNSLATQEVEPDTGRAWPEEYRPLLYRLAETSGNVHAILVEALAHGKALSFVHRVAVKRVQFAVNEYLRFWNDVNDERDLSPNDERNFPEVTADITHECKVAIAELNGTAPFADET